MLDRVVAASVPAATAVAVCSSSVAKAAMMLKISDSMPTDIPITAGGHINRAELLDGSTSVVAPAPIPSVINAKATSQQP